MDSSHSLSPLSRASSPELVRLARNALAHLYDAAYLENHPLAAVLDRGERLDRVTRAQRLRRTLLDCLDALRPNGTGPIGAEASRAHAILTYRYVDGMSMEEIAARRALSERQAYRELERGLEAVAALLVERIGELGELAGAPSGSLLSTRAEEPRGLPADPVRTAQVEAARLGESVAAESLRPDEVFDQVRAMLAPVFQQIGVQVEVRSTVAWPRIVADRVMFRQVILNLLTYAGHAVAPGRLVVAAPVEEAGMLQIAIAEERPPTNERAPIPPASGDDPVRLSVARALVEAQGGRLAAGREEGAWRARVWLPTAARRVILVIDDNQDLIALFQRYVVGHGFTIVGARDSSRAKSLAAELRPELILLDVMMPSLDGWEVLQQLTSAAETADLPVVVCSVLHEPELARGMGASGYLTKPVQQADLLAVLGCLRARPSRAR